MITRTRRTSPPHRSGRTGASRARPFITEDPRVRAPEPSVIMKAVGRCLRFAGVGSRSGLAGPACCAGPQDPARAAPAMAGGDGRRWPVKAIEVICWICDGIAALGDDAPLAGPFHAARTASGKEVPNRGLDLHCGRSPCPPGGSGEQRTRLHQHDDSVRQRAPASRPCARARAGRRACPALPAGRPRGKVPDRNRRQLAEERAGRRCGGHQHPRARRPECRDLRRAARAARAVVRRLHPHQQRPAAPARRGTAMAGLRGKRRFLPAGLCGPVLRGLRAVLQASRAARRQRVREQNWFFRLSRYAGRLHDLIDSGRLRIEPAARRNEVLRFFADGLADFSVSRPAARARGWGIPVPGYPGQVIYVWWDALGNYITALGYGAGGELYQRWWGGPGRRIHLAGKGVLRFHAVYWPAVLLSAGLPLPTDILVHDYLTIDGRKISKSAGSGQAANPVALAGQFGTDAVRWWLLREVPRVGDADFTADRLIARANDDLANGLGNLVSRVISMAHRYRQGCLRPLPGILPDGAGAALSAGAAVGAVGAGGAGGAEAGP